MFKQKEIQELCDFFLNLKDRGQSGVYFYRINGYNEKVSAFIRKYYEAARTTGVVQEGKIPNPDRQNLSYYEEIMGRDFRLSVDFISLSLKKWLPRMNDIQRKNVAESFYNSLESLHQSGKTEAMIGNAYIKFMCWLYYKFERILNRLGTDQVPKILYEGTVNHYELMLLSILCNSGCDVILLQYQGDEEYLKLDPFSEQSKELKIPALSKFPNEFNLRWLREKIKSETDLERIYGKKPTVEGCMNTWTSHIGLETIKMSVSERGNDKMFYHCFFRINGVEDKLTYLHELYQFQQEIKGTGRKLLILEREIPSPSVDEIASIQRKPYHSIQVMLQDLANKISFPNVELQLLIKKSFLDVLFKESKQEGMNIHKLTNKAVYLLCWIKRYIAGLFSSWKFPEVSCFIYLGNIRNENEAIFLCFLAGLPVDILLLNPNKDKSLPLLQDMICELNYENALKVETYPRETTEMQMGTAAYHAERELDTMMYQDSGMYRDRQFKKAITITLKTMYEEIELLWQQDLKYRTGFDTAEQMVTMPVIFAKVSGVKDQQVTSYWNGIRKLITEDTLLVTKAPYINHEDANPMKAFAAEFFKNGKLQRAKIKNHRNYPYKVLREEIQDYILDKLQLLIDQKIIQGTFENGMEYTIVSTILNMPKELLRLLQKFDFTKKNPKLIYINAGETMISLEDTIITAFLNLAGFDIVFFVPTGYQTIEQFFHKKLMEEHQIGDYMYDLQVPNFNANSPNHVFQTWRDKIFKRGR